MFRNDIPLTDEVKQNKNRLFWVFGLGLILALAKTGERPDFALSEILASMLFLCGIMYTNYCLLVFYIVLTLYSMIIYFMEFGKLAQIKIITGENPFTGLTSGMFFFFIILGITFLFDILAVYLTFLAYKVFKYEAFKGTVGGNGNQNGGQRFFADDVERNQRNAANNRPIFQGQGIVL